MQVKKKDALPEPEERERPADLSEDESDVYLVCHL